MNPPRLLTVFAAISIASSSVGQVTIVTSYSQNFDAIESGLPAGWGIWTSSTSTGNGTAYSWTGTPVANNAGVTATNAFRNVPGASQSWTSTLSTGSDRALGWRAGSSATRDGSITFTLENTLNYSLTSLSFDLFTPNSAGTAGVFQLQYQIGASGAFSQLASVSYTNNTAQNPLVVTSITLSALQLAGISNQSQQVTLRFDNMASSGTAFNSLALDNFAYTAIPEPSTYAAIFGAVALVGAAVHRRRQRAKAASV